MWAKTVCMSQSYNDDGQQKNEISIDSYLKSLQANQRHIVWLLSMVSWSKHLLGVYGKWSTTPMIIMRTSTKPRGNTVNSYFSLCKSNALFFLLFKLHPNDTLSLAFSAVLRKSSTVLFNKGYCLILIKTCSTHVCVHIQYVVKCRMIQQMADEDITWSRALLMMFYCSLTRRNNKHQQNTII